MEVGIYQLGGNSVVLEPGNSSWALEHRENVVMDSDKAEHIKDFVRVLERYVSAIGVRTFAKLENWETERTDPVINAFCKYASVPVINLESAMYHPCQAMADMMTIREKLGGQKKRVLLNWAWHPKPLPMAVPNSFALAAAQFGHDLIINAPPEYELDGNIVDQLNDFAKTANGNIEITSDAAGAFENVDVVYAKSWGSKNFYGNAENEIANREQFRKEWIVDAEKMKRTNSALFMHCLPVRRNVIVTDEVIDSERSVVIDQAENRLHIQKAILAELIK
jgi:N-acetylornithine carbamoyltransferase